MKPDNFQDLQRCVDMCIDEINENLEYTLGKTIKKDSCSLLYADYNRFGNYVFSHGDVYYVAGYCIETNGVFCKFVLSIDVDGKRMQYKSEKQYR